MGTESDNNEVLKEGFLVKRVRETLLNFLSIHIWQINSYFTGLLTNDVRFQGHVVQNWKVRWFVLKSDKLMYYKYEGGKRDSCHRGTIHLSNCKITCPCLEYENRPVSENSQSIRRCFYLFCVYTVSCKLSQIYIGQCNFTRYFEV